MNSVDYCMYLPTILDSSNDDNFHRYLELILIKHDRIVKPVMLRLR